MMIRLFREWRLRVWTVRVHKREVLLEAFQNYPHKMSMQVSARTSKSTLEDSLCLARYKLQVYHTLLRETPKAIVKEA
jgi:hypothetical protein